MLTDEVVTLRYASRAPACTPAHNSTRTQRTRSTRARALTHPRLRSAHARAHVGTRTALHMHARARAQAQLRASKAALAEANAAFRDTVARLEQEVAQAQEVTNRKARALATASSPSP